MDNFKVWDLYNRYIPKYLKTKIRILRYGSHYNKKHDLTKSIYIHIPKTAGTSVSSALYGESGLGHGHYTCYDFNLDSRVKFDSYYKFAFVRNPWDRLVSAYFYLLNPPEWVGDRTNNVSKYINENSNDFESFVILLAKDKKLQNWTHMIPQTNYIYSSGTLSVDFVGKFEALNCDVNTIGKNIGLSDIYLPHNNKSQKSKHYSEYYSDFSREFVNEFYKDDIENFNYKFEG